MGVIRRRNDDRPSRTDRTEAGDRPRSHPSRIFPIRIGLVAVMGSALAVLGGRAFDEFVPALLLAPPVVALAALVARRWRLTARVALEFGAVMLTTAAAGLLTGGDLDTLLSEAAAGPRRLFTTEWPSPLDVGVVMSVAFLIALVTAVSADLAGRARFHLAPLGPMMVGFAAVMAISAPVHPQRWALGVFALGALALPLFRPGNDPRIRVRLLIAERSLLATLAGLVGAALLASTAIAWADRADPRQDVEAELTLSLLDPVEQMVALQDAEPPFDLFEITDRSTLIGPSLPARWRLSALDEYDGQRWLPAITLRPIGRRLGQPTPASPDVAPPIRFDLTLRTDDLSLVPLPGRPLEVELDDGTIETDAERTVVRLTDPPDIDQVIRITSEVAPTAAATGMTTLETRQVDEIATAFSDYAEALGGDGTVLEQLRTIETTMREEWFLDRDATGAGQQLALIDRFVNETTRGTREQFVTAFVLLARSLGVDARVATGFLVPPAELRTPLDLTSSHATVWPEINLRGVGWLAFDPVPAEEAGGEDEPSPPPSDQSPAAAQPPDKPTTERTDESEPPDTEDEEVATTDRFGVWLVRGVIAAGAVVTPVVLAIAAIVLVKARRRRRRLRAGDPARRIVGAWANTTDSLVDAGLAINPSWTDDRIAARAVAVAPTVPHEVRRLASAATAMTFGAPSATPVSADDAVAASRSVNAAIKSERTRWQRVRWRLSTRSLRRSTRSPVVG